MFFKARVPENYKFKKLKNLHILDNFLNKIIIPLGHPIGGGS